MTEEDAEIVAVLASCCRVIGAFVPCSAWLPLLVDTLSDPKAGDISRANALVVTSCLVHAAAAAQQQPEFQLLQLLVAALAAEDTRCSEHVGVQLQLLSVVSNLLAWMPEDACTACAQQLYLILLQLHGTFAAQQEAEGPAAEADDSSGAGRAAAALQQLAQRCGLFGAGQLAEAHAQQMLSQLAADAGSWTAGSANLRGFMSLLRTAEGRCLAALLPQVAQVSACPSGIICDCQNTTCKSMAIDCAHVDGSMGLMQLATCFTAAHACYTCTPTHASLRYCMLAQHERCLYKNVFGALHLAYRSCIAAHSAYTLC
jgi:hypothetical protein